jgi:hypothetical protein
MAEQRCACSVLVSVPQGKRPLWRCRFILEDNIKIPQLKCMAVNNTSNVFSVWCECMLVMAGPLKQLKELATRRQVTMLYRRDLLK